MTATAIWQTCDKCGERWWDSHVCRSTVTNHIKTLPNGDTEGVCFFTTPMAQPEALRLAQLLEDADGVMSVADDKKIAAELRRLHAENERLKLSQYGSGRLQELRDQRDRDTALMRQALEALEFMEPYYATERDTRNAAIAALKERLK